MKISDEDLRRILGDVPPVPDTVRGLVERRLRRSRQVRFTLWAIAACIALFVVGSAREILLKPHVSTHGADMVVMDEVEQELREISAFLNGGTIDEEIQGLALVSIEGL